MERKTPYNSTFAICGVSSTLDSFMVAEKSILLTNFCAKNPRLRKAANCYALPLQTIPSKNNF